MKGRKTASMRLAARLTRQEFSFLLKFDLSVQVQMSWTRCYDRRRSTPRGTKGTREHHTRHQNILNLSVKATREIMKTDQPRIKCSRHQYNLE